MMDKLLPVPTKPDAALPGDPNFNQMEGVEQILARLDEIKDVEVLVELQHKARALAEYFTKNEQQARISIIGPWERRDKPAWRSEWKSRTSKG